MLRRLSARWSRLGKKKDHGDSGWATSESFDFGSEGRSSSSFPLTKSLQALSGRAYDAIFALTDDFRILDDEGLHTDFFEDCVDGKHLAEVLQFQRESLGDLRNSMCPGMAEQFSVTIPREYSGPANARLFMIDTSCEFPRYLIGIVIIKEGAGNNRCSVVSFSSDTQECVDATPRPSDDRTSFSSQKQEAGPIAPQEGTFLSLPCSVLSLSYTATTSRETPYASYARESATPYTSTSNESFGDCMPDNKTNRAARKCEAGTQTISAQIKETGVNTDRRPPLPPKCEERITKELQRMDGTWISRSPGVGEWLECLHLDAKARAVIDGVGQVVKLVFKGDSIMFEGGKLTLEGEYLMRTGKSGRAISFERADHFICDEESPQPKSPDGR